MNKCKHHILYYRFCIPCNRANGIRFVFEHCEDSNFEWIEVMEVPE